MYCCVYGCGCNVPLAIALVWISNPITIPPLFYFTYRLGTLILGEPETVGSIELSLTWLSGQIGSCLATTDPGFTGLWSVTRQPVVRAGQIVLALEDRSLPGKAKSKEQSRSHSYLRTSAGLMEAARYAG